MLRIAPEVDEALGSGGAVVALETTLVAHGFPPGEGVAVGLAAEAAVREAGAVPATVGVVDGEVRVGLTEAELGRFDEDAAAPRAAIEDEPRPARRLHRFLAARARMAAPSATRHPVLRRRREVAMEVGQPA